MKITTLLLPTYALSLNLSSTSTINRSNLPTASAGSGGWTMKKGKPNVPPMMRGQVSRVCRVFFFFFFERMYIGISSPCF